MIGATIACDRVIVDKPPIFFTKSYIKVFIECGEISGKKVQVESNIGLRVDTVNKIFYRNNNENFSVPYSINDDVWLSINASSAGYIYRDSSIYYAVPQIGRTDFLLSNGDDPNDPFYLERQKGYDKYINIIGDTTYNKEEYAPSQTTAIITPVKEFVITSDKDYANFSAGSNLNKLFTVYFDNPYATVKNNYQAIKGSYHYDFIYDYPISVIRTNLGDVNFPSYKFIGNQWLCHLDIAPDKTDTYTFYVKVILDDGTMLEGTDPVTISIKGKD